MFNFSNCLCKSAAKLQNNHNFCKKMQKKMYKYMNFAKSTLQNPFFMPKMICVFEKKAVPLSPK